MSTLTKLPKLLRLKEIEKAAIKSISQKPKLSEVAGQGLDDLFAGVRERPMPSPEIPARRPMFESQVKPMPEPGIPSSFPPKPMDIGTPGLEAEPSRLMQQAEEFQKIGGLPPEVRKFYGLDDMRFTRQGRLPEAGGELGYEIDTASRQDALTHIFNMIEDWEKGGGALKGDLPLNIRTKKVHGPPSKVLTKVDPGRGNYGKDKEWFYGVQSSGDFYDKDSKKLFQQWFTPSKVSLSEKETLREILPVRTQNKTVVKAIEESIAIYDAHISKKESVIKTLKKLYGEDGKNYRLNFYKDWVYRTVDKKGWLKENEKNKALVKFMASIERDEKLIGLIDEHKAMIKAAEKGKPLPIKYRPSVGGEPKADIDRFIDRSVEVEPSAEEAIVDAQRRMAVAALPDKRWVNEKDIPITSGADTGHRTLRDIIRRNKYWGDREEDLPKTRFWAMKTSHYKTPEMFKNLPEPKPEPKKISKVKALGFKVNPYDMRKAALRKALKKKS